MRARPNRRETVTALGATVLMPLLPRQAEARGPLGQAVVAMFGERSIRDGRVNLDLPGLAEDGSFVALTVRIDSPMRPDNRVVSAAVFAPDNPRALVASVGFGPRTTKAEFRSYIRLAQSQNVVVIAEMSNGELWRGRAHVEVTPGTCEFFPVN